MPGRSDAGFLALRSRRRICLLAAHQALVHGLPRDAEHSCGDTYDVSRGKDRAGGSPP